MYTDDGFRRYLIAYAMKNCYFLILILLSCSADQESDALKFLQTTRSQHFMISKKQGGVIEGEEGSRVFFPPDAFETDSEEIHVLLTEFYQPIDLIANKLSTYTMDNEPLTTSGMILIDARAGGAKVNLKSGMRYQIRFPKKIDRDYMQLFYGQRKADGFLKWTPVDEFCYDTLFVEQRFANRDNSANTVEADFAINISHFYIVNDDTTHVEYADDFIPDTVIHQNFTGVDWDTPAGRVRESDFYWLASSQLGYINCDYFIRDGDSELAGLVIQVNGSLHPRIYAVFPNLNAFLIPDSQTPSGMFEFYNFPLNESFTLIAFADSNNDFYFSKQNHTIAQSDTLTISLEPSTQEEIKRELEGLAKL